MPESGSLTQKQDTGDPAALARVIADFAADKKAIDVAELDLRGVLAGGVPTDMPAQVNHLSANPTAGPGFAVAARRGRLSAVPHGYLKGVLLGR